LNVLLPLQIITGALMWGVQRWPAVAESLGGLPYLAPFHTLIAWLFAAFIVAHVYLTTTGAKPLTAIQAIEAGHLKPDTDADQLVYELDGLFVALMREARFLRDPRAAERAWLAYERLISSLLAAPERRPRH